MQREPRPVEMRLARAMPHPLSHDSCEAESHTLVVVIKVLVPAMWFLVWRISSTRHAIHFRTGNHESLAMDQANRETRGVRIRNSE